MFRPVAERTKTSLLSGGFDRLARFYAFFGFPVVFIIPEAAQSRASQKGTSIQLTHASGDETVLPVG